MNKAARYERIFHQIDALLAKCDDQKARMATVCAVLHHKMPDFFWTGFYLLNNGRLLVSTYQGPVACMELAKNKGVCWAAINTGKVTVVPDVHQFEGHIACDSRSKSEIVVPLFSHDGEILGVLDVDSVKVNTFDAIDAEWLDKVIRLII
jgi:GAF domain-containing protein